MIEIIKKIIKFFWWNEPRWRMLSYTSPSEIYSSWENFKDNLYGAIIIFLAMILFGIIYGDLFGLRY